MDKTEASGVFKTQVDSSINYMEEIDETLNHEQKKLIVTLSCQKKREEIEKIAKALKGDIKNLAQTIQDILDKHHKDYISTFASFMDTVRKDLKLKLEQMEKIEEEKRKINDVKIIKCERDYFRLESVRMNKLCKTLSSKIDDMALRMKILSDEVNNLTIKWKDSETTNKQLFLELESSMQAQKEIEKEMLGLKEIIQNSSSKPTDIISLMAIEGIKNIENPFEMIGVKDIMEDLDICKNMAYKVFQRDDFPSVSVGKQHKIMLIAYIIWKMQKRV